METYYGYIRTPADAIKLFEACRRGVLPRVQRRLSEKERQLIRSGSVFVWDEREAGMRRWTDGKSWSASRVSGSFLSYREMEGKRGGRLMSPPLSLKQTTGASPDSGLNSDEDIDHEEPDGYRYKPNGLIKQSFSIKTSTGRHLHLISYFSRTATSNAVELCQPTTDPQLRHIKLVKGMYPDVTSHESQGSMNIRALVPASPFTQLHPAHVEHVGASKSSQETLGRPYQLSHSPEYQWPSSPTMISPLTSSFTGTAHSISPLQSPHHSNTPSTPSFNSSSPHVLHRPLESYQPQTAHVFNHPDKRKSGSLSPSQSVVNHAHLLSLRSRENSSTAKTLEQQGSLSIHTFNSSTESVAELNSISDPDHPEPIQDTRKAPILSSPLPDLNPKNAGNGLSNLNPRSTPVFKPLQETSLAANHSSRSDLSNRISLERLDLPWNTNYAVNCSIPPITTLTLFTESISQSNCSNTSEHLGTTAPKYWERLSFKGRDMRCEVLREQSDFIGEDQRAIRVLNRKFCV